MIAAALGWLVVCFVWTGMFIGIVYVWYGAFVELYKLIKTRRR